MRNLVTFLHLQSQLSGKFQRFDESMKMLKNSWIFKNFYSNEKFYQTQTASRLQEIIQPSPNLPSSE